MDNRIEALINIIRVGDWEAGQEAAHQLAQIGVNAIDPLIDLLREYQTFEDYEAEANPHSLAEEALIEIGDPAVEPLIAALKDETWGVREGAVYVLGKSGDVRAIQPLIEALAWSNPGSEIYNALLGFGEISLRPLLYALKNHENAAVRSGAAYLVSQFSEPLVVPALLEAVEGDADESVCVEAVSSLGKLRDARTIEPLIAVLEDGTPVVREAAVRTLGEIGAAVGGTRIGAALGKALHDSDWGTRQSAAEMLIRLHSEHQPEAEALLLNDLQNEYVEIQLGAAWSMVELDDLRAFDPLVRLLKSDDAQIARMAALGLGTLKDARAVVPLNAALNHTEKDVQEAARDALRRLGQSE
jgi:HEAT repeat protein